MYLVCYDDWWSNENYFFNQLENAKNYFNKLKEPFYLGERDLEETITEDKITIENTRTWEKVYMYKIIPND